MKSGLVIIIFSILFSPMLHASKKAAMVDTKRAVEGLTTITEEMGLTWSDCLQKFVQLGILLKKTLVKVKPYQKHMGLYVGKIDPDVWHTNFQKTTRLLWEKHEQQPKALCFAISREGDYFARIHQDLSSDVLGKRVVRELPSFVHVAGIIHAPKISKMVNLEDVSLFLTYLSILQASIEKSIEIRIGWQTRILQEMVEKEKAMMARVLSRDKKPGKFG